MRNIVLVHGWGASSAKLEPLARELRKLGWNTFVPKLPGFDLKAPEIVWYLDDYVNFVLAAASKHFKNKPFMLFGHSFGGGVALKAASYKKVEGIVLCETRGISRTNSLKRYLFLVIAKVGKALLVFLPLAYFWKKLLYKVAHEHDYEKLDGIMKETFKNVVSEDLKKAVSAVRKPVLILWGDADTMTPVKDAHFLHEQIKKSKLVVFPGERHTLPYVRALALAQEIASWQSYIK